MKVNYRYFLTIGSGPEREVTERTYREAEFNYGFETPRQSFTCDAASGRIKAEVED